MLSGLFLIQGHIFQLSRFERTTPVLPGLSEISRFEMILTQMSEIYEFFKSITLFTNSMWKSWLLIAKVCACIALVHDLHHQLYIRVNKALIVLALVKEASETSLQINTIFNVQTKKSTVELNRLTLLLCYMDIQEISREDIAEFNFLGIIRQSKRSWRAHF